MDCMIVLHGMLKVEGTDTSDVGHLGAPGQGAGAGQVARWRAAGQALWCLWCRGGHIVKVSRMWSRCVLQQGRWSIISVADKPAELPNADFDKQ